MSSQPHGNWNLRDRLEWNRAGDGLTKTNGVHPENDWQSPADPPGNCTVEPRRPLYVRFKVFIDAVLAVLLLVIVLPVMLVAAALVKLTSRGPAFYRQVRLGLDGRPFTLVKLRTMIHDAEAGTGPVWSTDGDHRITPLGRILRSTHIDEFPQLLQVLAGRMSLVGPRPERPEFVAKLEWEIPYYRERLRVRPGITGLAQLRLPPDSSLDSVRKKLICDLYYVRYVGPWLDLRLLVLTAWSLIRELTHCLLRCVALPNQQTIERGFEQALGTRPGSHGAAVASPVLPEPAGDLGMT